MIRSRGELKVNVARCHANCWIGQATRRWRLMAWLLRGLPAIWHNSGCRWQRQNVDVVRFVRLYIADYK